MSARTFDPAFNFETPTVAVVAGHAVAGGLAPMISCDFAFAEDTARIGDFHIRHALFGGAGPSSRPPRTEALIALESMSGSAAHQWQDAKGGVQALVEKRDPSWKPA